MTLDTADPGGSVSTTATDAPVAGLDRPLLRGSGLTKRFGRVAALTDVSLTLAAGEVLALVGDNGAGKSTLLNIVAGALPPDEGRLEIDGRPVAFATPNDARRAGIASVFQDLALVECLDVATNVFLGDLPRRGPFVDRRRMESVAIEVISRVTADIRSARQLVSSLPGGHRQAVAVARALRTDARVLTLDEPTAALGFTEKAHVADVIRRLRDEGRGVLLVSHDLELVFAVADRIQVLRLGETAGVLRCADTDRDAVIGLITGART